MAGFPRCHGNSLRRDGRSSDFEWLCGGRICEAQFCNRFTGKTAAIPLTNQSTCAKLAFSGYSFARTMSEIGMTTERVATMLREGILSGKYADGSALRQEPLAAALGCSRIPVREALRQLEAEGLVVMLPRRGAMVAEMSIERIRESFELRSILEPWLLSESIPFLLEEDFTAAQAVIDEMGAIGIEKWGEANWRFHEILYARCGKTSTLALVRGIHDSVDRYIRVHLQVTSGQAKAHRDHREILDLCRARNVHRAAAALTSHILDVADKLVESVTLARSLRGDDQHLHPAKRTRKRRS